MPRGEYDNPLATMAPIHRELRRASEDDSEIDADEEMAAMNVNNDTRYAQQVQAERDRSALNVDRENAALMAHLSSGSKFESQAVKMRLDRAQQRQSNAQDQRLQSVTSAMDRNKRATERLAQWSVESQEALAELREQQRKAARNWKGAFLALIVALVVAIFYVYIRSVMDSDDVLQSISLAMCVAMVAVFVAGAYWLHMMDGTAEEEYLDREAEWISEGAQLARREDQAAMEQRKAKKRSKVIGEHMTNTKALHKFMSLSSGHSLRITKEQRTSHVKLITGDPKKGGNLRDCEVIDIQEWLQTIGLGARQAAVCEIFDDNQIDGASLLMLTEQMLRDEMGIPWLGVRLRLWRAIVAVSDAHGGVSQGAEAVNKLHETIGDLPDIIHLRPVNVEILSAHEDASEEHKALLDQAHEEARDVFGGLGAPGGTSMAAIDEEMNPFEGAE